MRKIHNAAKYIAFTAISFAVFDIILSRAIHGGYDIQHHPLKHLRDRGVWVVEKEVMSPEEWRRLEFEHKIFLSLTWIFLTSGTTHVLESDFNTASNQINGIGSGKAGGAGQAGQTGGAGSA